MPWSLLVKDVPPEHHHDLDYIIGMLDWEENVDPEFGEAQPAPSRAGARRGGDGGGRLPRVVDRLTATAHFSAKELTVLPGRSVVIRDAAAYGVILTEGRGALGGWMWRRRR